VVRWHHVLECPQVADNIKIQGVAKHPWTADKGWGLSGKLATIHRRKIYVFLNVTHSVGCKSPRDNSTDTNISKTKNPSLRSCSHLVAFLADLLHWQQTTTVFLEDGKPSMLTLRREDLGKNYVTPSRRVRRQGCLWPLPLPGHVFSLVELMTIPQHSSKLKALITY